MKQSFKRLMAICLMVALLGTLVLQAAPAAQAADYLQTLPQKHYGEYGTVNMVYDQGSCYSMQGMAVDATYAYCAKIGSNDAVACITRLEKATGAKVNMINASNGGYYFYNLGHANALDIVKINGVQQMFVTAGATLVRLTMSGTTLTTAGTYTFTYNGATTNTTAVQIMYASNTEVKVITKGGKSLYTGTLDPTASSGTIALTHLCNLDTTNVRLKGEMHDYSTWTQQGFDYHDGKVFLPLTGNAVVETINHSVVLVYDVEGASGTVRNDPTLSFRIISGQYSGLFEIEDVEVCNYDGKLYFSSNRRKTESDTNYDGVSFFAGYVYDPAMSTTGPADYRWETVNNEWVSTTQDGNVFNNAIRVNGNISSNTMSQSVYHMSRSVVLKHDKPWVIEWKSSGSFAGGGMLLSASKTSNGLNTPYIFRFQNSTFISMGYFDGTQHNNYGIKLSDYGIDGIAEHVYRLTNKIDETGYNLVYLSIDGEELGPLNNYYIGLADQNRKEDWVKGKDFTFSYQGTLDNSLNQCKLDYLQIWADGVPATANNRYLWESKNDNLTSANGSGYTENVPTIYSGTVSGTTYTNAAFRLDQPVRLMHDRNWSVEWQSEGTPTSVFLLSAAEGGKNPGAPYLFRYGTNLIFLGANDGTQHANYGIDLSDHGIDGTAKHTYRLSNKIASDGSNMVYLYVDDVELGPMNNFYGGITDKETTSDWLNGKDLVFDYVGNRSYAMGGTYHYLKVIEHECVHSYTSAVTTAAGCETTGVKTYTCSKCGDQYTEVIAAVGHKYTSKVTAPSCNAEGYTTYTCSVCGHSYEGNVTAATGHSYKTVTVDATCTTTGSITKTCSTCGDKQVQTIAAVGHKYSSTVIDPTCTTKGYTNYTCSACGHSYTANEVAATGHKYQEKITTAAGCVTTGVKTFTCAYCNAQYTEVIAATGHSYTSKVTAPTCTADGYTTYTCATCGHSYKDNVVNALGHSYKTVTVDPTCTKTGSITDTCSTCGDKQVQTIAATGHSYSSKVTDPTCTGKGYTTYTCHCGDTYTANEVAALGHKYQAVITTAPGCESAGVKTFTCSTCGDKYTEPLAATGHKYNSKVTAPTCTATGYTTYTCTCGHSYKANEVAALGHSYKTVTVDPTCTEAGSITDTCATCGDTKVQTIAATGHSYTSKVTAPTCTAKGYTTYTCHCSDTYTADEVAALGHKYTSEVTTAAGCETTGVKTFTCSACGDQYTESIPATGHSHTAKVTAPTCTEAGYTTYTCECGDSYTADEVAALGHKYQVEITTNPGCDSAGVKTYTCETCGDQYTEPLASTGHNYTAEVTAPTCTEAGYTTYTCPCGHSYKDNEVAALGHSYETVTVDPTCTEAGSITDTCATCGNTKVETIPATGHSYNAVVTDPTCTEVGYTTYTCACGDSYTADEVAALGHSYETVTVDPTCTETGSITDTCATCGDTKVETIPATGHSYNAVVTDPTCTEVGYTTYTCACGDSYTADEVAALGHSFAEGICGVCGEADPDYIQPVVIPTLTLKSPTLEFKDMITVNAFFTAENIDDVVEMGMITYKEKVDEWNVETAAYVIPGTTFDENTGRYIAHSQGINAKYLGDTVYLACYAKLTDGSFVYTKLAPYSPVQYATNQLKNSTDVKLKQLCAAMLNYGAEAQLFFEHNMDALANSSLTDEQKALPEAYRDDMVATVPAVDAAKQGIFANNKGFVKRYPSISFEGAFCINYFFTPNYAPVGDITLYYWNEADFAASEVLTKENASGTLTLVLEESGQYRADIEGIAAKNLSAAVYVAAVYTDGTTEWTSGVLGYSIGAYCASQISKGADVAALAEATAVYGYHAKAFFEV